MARVLLAISVLAVGAAGCGKTGLDAGDELTLGGASSAGSGRAGAEARGGMALGGAGSGGSGHAGAEVRGGSAGAVAVGALTKDCEQSCNTIGWYLLPRALCEDWKRPGWQPEFCDFYLDSTGDYPERCTEYCAAVHGGVSPECALTLPAVTRCVSPLYASYSEPRLSECWLEGCLEPLFAMTSACYGLREQLEAGRATWAGSGISNYQLRYGASSSPIVVEVRAGRVVSVTPSGATRWTVPELFAEVERLLATPGVAPAALYDPFRGHVTHLSREEGCSSTELVSGVEVTPHLD